MKLFLHYSYSLLFIFSLLFLFTPRVLATTYYVSTNGADTNNGTLAAPWKTLVYAATKLAAGDTLTIRGGVYQEKVTFAKSGTSTQPIKIMSYPGETAVVDGNYQIPTGTFSAIVVFSGSYLQVEGIEVRNSYWQGIEVSGANVTLSRIVSHDNMEHGIIMWGSANAVVQDSIIYNNAKSLEDGYHHFGRTNYSTGLSAAVGADKTMLRRNKIYNNWGEGLSTFNATNTTMEDNIVYDNSKNVYLSDTDGMLVQRNLVYCTPNNKWRLSSIVTQHGINFQDEEQKPASKDVIIINNVVVGCVTNFKWYPFTTNSSMNNVLIAHNTFVNATGTTSDAAFTIAAAKDIAHINTRIINNIIEQDDSKTIGSFATPNEGVTFSNNIWSKAPPQNMMGANSLVADPKLAKTGSLTSGALTSDYFKLMTNSPAIDHGMNLSEVTTDFVGVARPKEATSDIGAFESGGTAPSPTVTTPPITNTVIPSPTVPISPTIPSSQPCQFKKIGDADCAKDNLGRYVNILDYAIWYSEFINSCSASNLAGCGSDSDHDGNVMDANFNYPGTNYIATDTKVDAFDYAVWIQGMAVQNQTTPTITLTPSVTPSVTFSAAATATPTKTPTSTPTPSLTLSPTKQPTTTPATSMVEQAFTAAIKQVGNTNNLSSTAYPYYTKSDNTWNTTGASSWTSGFYPGVLWFLYEKTGNTAWKDRATQVQAGIESQKNNTSTHDVGFMLGSSFGNGYRLTQNASWLQVLLTTATSLATRYNATVGCIKSWNASGTDFKVIIDNMMNLEILYFGAAHGGNSEWKAMATSHALKTMQNHVRPDGSTYHQVIYDSTTGAVKSRGTVQGYSDSSTWARGQAWAIYGFTISYRETKDARFLDTARKVSDYFISHLPADHVPYWDFQAPNIPNEPRDSSAASIAAAGLLELSKLETDTTRAAKYHDEAVAILTSLSSPAYLATNGQAILLHATQNKKSGIYDTGLIYADYYYLKALLLL